MTVPATPATAAPRAPGAPWRRLRATGRPDRRASAPSRNAWSWPRAGIRLLAIIPIMVAGVLRLASPSFAHVDASTRRARRAVLMRTLAADLLRSLHVRVVVAGPRPPGPVLYACNHLSWLDVLVLLVALPDSVLISKSEVASWPLIGRFVRETDTVLVDRAPTRALPIAIAEVSALLSRGRSVVLFAEGTTTDGSRVLPFKSPFFEAAIHAGVPVVPVSLRASTGPGGPNVARHVCWWGDDSLAAHLPLVAGTRRICYVVRLGDPLKLAPAQALAPTRFSVAPASADHALRRTRSALRQLLARRTHRVVARQAGHLGSMGVAEAQERRNAIEELLLGQRDYQSVGA